MKLFSWGANSYGQLSHGVKSEQCIVPRETSLDSSLNPSHITSIAGGGGHTLVLDKDGQVFGCGWNNKGQLGEPTVFPEILSLKKLEILKDYEVHQVFCGWESSLAVTCSKELFAWGSNTFSEIGLSKDKIKSSSIPLSVPVPSISVVSCGLRHTALVSEAGQVFVCGSGKKGQLGITAGDGNSLPEARQPIPVPGLSSIRSVACGQHHTVALSDSGRLYVWGDNRHGQLGFDSASYRTIPKPTELQPFPGETLPTGCRIFCGWTHTVVLTEGGEVYNCGRNSYGQLGYYEHERAAAWKLTRLEGLKGVKQMEVGSEHNLALLHCGQVVSWGWNEHGNCGIGTEENVVHPTPVTIGSARLIGTGAGHSFALV